MKKPTITTDTRRIQTQRNQVKESRDNTPSTPQSKTLRGALKERVPTAKIGLAMTQKINSQKKVVEGEKYYEPFQDKKK